MKERADFTETPGPIREWLMFPYRYFSDLYGNKNLTLLDIACGNNLQIDIIKDKFHKVISMDKEISPGVLKGDILNIPLADKSVDVSFCFETIEHVEDGNRVIEELIRVTNSIVVIGSVNKYGPSHIDGLEIFKNGLNPYHVKEYDVQMWKSMFKNDIIMQSKQINDVWIMSTNVNIFGISNYAIINLQK